MCILKKQQEKIVKQLLQDKDTKNTKKRDNNNLNELYIILHSDNIINNW